MAKQLSFFDKIFFPQSQRKKTPGKPADKGAASSSEELLFCNQPVNVNRRAYKRNMTLTIKPNGKISVSVSKSMPQQKIVQFLNEHKNWIEKHSLSLGELRSRYPKPRYEEGDIFSFSGRKVKLCVRSSFGERAVTLLEGDDLYVYLSNKQFADIHRTKIVEAKVREFYKEEGSRRLFTFVEKQSYRMGLRPNRVSFRSQKSRWGSCSSKGHISLNWKLIVAPLFVQNYVVTHELAHLKHMNHSKAFWALVKEYCPEYKEAEDWLKKNHFEADFLSTKSELYS